MQAIGSARKGSGRSAAAVFKDSVETYSSNFYLDPPYSAVTNLQDFETMALERLKVLRIVESAGLSTNKFSEAYTEVLLKNLSKELRQRYIRSSGGSPEETERDRERDVLSHFILQMVYCRSEENRRWFIQAESDLFRFRLNAEPAAAIVQFINDINLGYSPLPMEEYRNLRSILPSSTFLGWGIPATDVEFYKMDFLDALHLVSKRHVFLNQGFAYVPRRFLDEVVTTRFREHLAKQLAQLARTMADSEEDTRLQPVLARLAQGYTGKDYSVSDMEFGVNLENLNVIALESFPLCSRNMHEHLRREHHLKHWARLQYGLFLKGTGLSLDDALKLFRAEFAQHGESESSLKQLAYNVRHMYGKEGKRTNYTPYSCMKIITTNPPTNGDHHGCPYKHFDKNVLATRIRSYGIGNEHTKQIVDLARDQHYMHACTKYFEVVHKKVDPAMGVIEHPNQYFEESRRLLHPESIEGKPSTYRKQTDVNRFKNDRFTIKSEPIGFEEGSLVGEHGNNNDFPLEEPFDFDMSVLDEMETEAQRSFVGGDESQSTA